MESRCSLQISQSKLQKLHEIGNGKLGQVFLGKWEELACAIKELKVNSISNDEFDNEASNLLNYRHQNIVAFLGVSYSQEGTRQLIFEYVPNGTLFHCLQSHKKVPKLSITSDIAKGLVYLHDVGMIHGNLKSNNILLTSEWKAKIANFGFEKLKLAAKENSSEKESVRWCAPELLQDTTSHKSQASDIWSFGMVVWEIVSEKIPFEEESNERKVMQLIRTYNKPPIPSCMSIFESIINKCCTIEINSRSRASEILSILESYSKEPRSCLRKAVDVLKQAIDNDRACNYRRAYQLYLVGLEYLLCGYRSKFIACSLK